MMNTLTIRYTGSVPIPLYHRQIVPGEVRTVSPAQWRQIQMQFPERFEAVAIASSPPQESVAEDAFTPLEALGLSSRIHDTLTGAGITSVESLQAYLDAGDAALLALDGIGPKALDEIKSTLQEA